MGGRHAGWRTPPILVPKRPDSTGCARPCRAARAGNCTGTGPARPRSGPECESGPETTGRQGGARRPALRRSAGDSRRSPADAGLGEQDLYLTNAVKHFRHEVRSPHWFRPGRPGRRRPQAAHHPAHVALPALARRRARPHPAEGPRGPRDHGLRSVLIRRRGCRTPAPPGPGRLPVRSDDTRPSTPRRSCGPDAARAERMRVQLAATGRGPQRGPGHRKLIRVAVKLSHPRLAAYQPWKKRLTGSTETTVGRACW